MKQLSKILGIDHVELDYSIDEYLYDPEISRQEALKRNSDFVECSHCGVVGNRPNMIRWHFDNCKTILKNCEQCGSTIPRQGIKDFLYKNKKYCNRSCYMESKKGKVFLEMTPEMREKISKAKKEYHVRCGNLQTK